MAYCTAMSANDPKPTLTPSRAQPLSQCQFETVRCPVLKQETMKIQYTISYCHRIGSLRLLPRAADQPQRMRPTG